ncbi:hypothetical protein D4Z78_14630 [Okeania hirsuta]|nr:hypothetical protein D4Z78_14630 [Okeania hirsuta]
MGKNSTLDPPLPRRGITHKGRLFNPHFQAKLANSLRKRGSKRWVTFFCKDSFLSPAMLIPYSSFHFGRPQ